jgi:predicted dehydrogenase
MPDIVFTGVADRDVARGSEIGSTYGVPHWEDYRELLDRVDAVTVAAPTGLHNEIALACIERGVHALIEKPISSTSDEARTLVKEASRAGLVLQPGHVERFNPTISELAKVLDGKKLLALEARRLSPFVERVADVSVVMDLMIHDLDLAVALLGTDASLISAAGTGNQSTRNDHVSAILRFDDGVMGTFTASKMSQQKVRELNVYAEGMVVQADMLRRTIVIHRDTTSNYRQIEDQVSYREDSLISQVYVPPIEPLYAEIQHFIACVIGSARPVISDAEIISVLELSKKIDAEAYAR